MYQYMAIYFFLFFNKQILIFIDLSYPSKRILLNNGQILRILNLNHDLDSGIYQCNATNFSGQISKKIYLDVKGKEKFYLK